MRKYDHTHFCGGFIITPRWLGTTAHCLVRYTTLEVYVVAGSAVFDEGFAAMLQRFYIHPEYVKATIEHDIGLMYTRLAIPEDKNTKRIYLGTDIVIGGRLIYCVISHLVYFPSLYWSR